MVTPKPQTISLDSCGYIRRGSSAPHVGSLRGPVGGGEGLRCGFGGGSSGYHPGPVRRSYGTAL